MSEITIYIIILIATVAILNGNFSFGAIFKPQVKDQSLLVIEHLSQYTTRQKDYRKTPKNFSSFGCAVHGRIVGEDVFLEYKFPLVDSHESQFKIKLNAKTTSSIINNYGCKTSCFGPVGDDRYALKSNDAQFLTKNMNKDGFYFRGFGKNGFGINHNEVIKLSDEINYAVASFIESELKRIGKDSYENRIRAALNFVQFIPYGIPDFDAGDDCYFGLALPHESLAISYSDCDSKSVLFAGILHHLISEQNIILVGCIIEEGGHMIAGVAGIYFKTGHYYPHQGKDYLLIETTTPIALENQPSNRFLDVKIISIKQQ